MFFVFALITALSVSANGIQSYVNIKGILQEEAFGKLRSAREERKRQIEAYFEHITNQVISFSERPMVLDAMTVFKKVFHESQQEWLPSAPAYSAYLEALRYHYTRDFMQKLHARHAEFSEDIASYVPTEAATVFLQYHYLLNGSQPEALQETWHHTAETSAYSRVHAVYHPVIQSYLRRFGFTNIFLVDEATGQIVYSVAKEIDYATNLLTGPYQHTPLAVAFNGARVAARAGDITLVDFASYLPSSLAPAAFVACPIYDQSRKIGVAVFQISIDAINRIMTSNFQWSNDGMGHKSGETYLVGTDFTMRTDARALIETPQQYFATIARLGIDAQALRRMQAHKTSIMLQPVRTVAAEEAMRGHTDARLITDYRGIPVLSTYAPLHLPDLRWVIVAEIDAAEIFAPLYMIRRSIGLTSLSIVFVALILGLLLVNRTVRPILDLIKGLEAFGLGNLSQRVTPASHDEIGQLAVAFNTMAAAIEHNTTALQRAEGRFRRLLEAAPNAIVISNDAGHIVLLNAETERTFGYTREELSGQSIDLLVPEPFRAAHEAWRHEYYNDPQIRQMRSDREVSARHKDGRIFPAEISLNPLETAEGLLVISVIPHVQEV